MERQRSRASGPGRDAADRAERLRVGRGVQPRRHHPRRGRHRRHRLAVEPRRSGPSGADRHPHRTARARVLRRVLTVRPDPGRRQQRRHRAPVGHQPGGGQGGRLRRRRPGAHPPGVGDLHPRRHLPRTLLTRRLMPVGRGQPGDVWPGLGLGMASSARACRAAPRCPPRPDQAGPAPAHDGRIQLQARQARQRRGRSGIGEDGHRGDDQLGRPRFARTTAWRSRPLRHPREPGRPRSSPGAAVHGHARDRRSGRKPRLQGGFLPGQPRAG